MWLDVVPIFAVCAWIAGRLHGPDARNAIGIYLAFTAGWSYCRSRSLPSRGLWAYLIRAWKSLENSAQRRWALLALAALCSLTLGVLKTWSNRYALYDQGIVTQFMWSLGHGEGFRYTLSGTGNFFYDHLAPAFVFALPFQWVFSYHPMGLVVTSTLCIWGGVVAWIKMAKDSRFLQVAILIFAVFFESFWSNLDWGIHETHFAFLFLSWGYLFYSDGKFARALILFCLTGLTKEIFLLDIAVLGLCLSWVEKGGRRRVAAVAMSLVMLATFAAYRIWINQRLVNNSLQNLQSGAINWFGVLYGYLGATTPAGLIREFFSHPLEVLQRWRTQVGSGIFFYPFQLLLAFAFAPVWGRGISRAHVILIAVIPSFLTAWLSVKPQLRDWGFHYVLMLWPTLFMVSKPILARHKILTLLWVWLAIIHGGQDYLKEARSFWAEGENRTQLLERMSQIPVEASVIAQDEVGLALAARRWIQVYPTHNLIPGDCPDWFVFTKEFLPDFENRFRTLCKEAYHQEWMEAGVVGLKKIKP